MIVFTDKEKRREASAITTQALSGKLPQMPSVFEGFKQRKAKTMRRAISDGLYHGGFGRCKVSGGRWFWVVCVMCQPWTVYGFADSESQAQEDALRVASEDFPIGVRFHFRAGSASSWYRERFAKQTHFAEDWRERFPTWADRTHLYCYSDCSSGFQAPLEGSIQIVAVTDKKVFVYSKRLGNSHQLSRDELSRIRRQECYSFDRQELESKGSAWHDKLFERFYLERNPEFLNWRPARQAVQPRVDELRREMQRQHPDRGGDVELFMAAQREYKQLREILTNGEWIAKTGGLF